ncbi:MAG: carbohydrate porin, partial [Roseiarcus sp.]
MTAWADDAAAKSDTSGEFVETPVGASAAATPAPANSGELVEQPVNAAGAAPAPSTAPSGSGPLGFLSTASHSSNLLGDMWGVRPFLSKYGMTLTAVENSELFGNVSGGVRQGLEYNGLTTVTLQMDTQRAFGLNGGLFNVSAEQIHGGNLSASNLYTLQTASGIEADRATR